MSEVTLHTSGVETQSGSGAGMAPASTEFIGMFVHVTASSGVLPTLSVKLQESPNGSDWYDVPNAGNVVSLAGLGIGTSSIFAANSGQQLLDNVRCVWTIGGVNPSFTFEVLLGTV